MKIHDVAIVSAVRTPIGKFNGSLKPFSAVELGIAASKAAIERANLSPEMIQHTILGNVLQAGLGQNPARQISLGSHIPHTSTAMTVNEVCGSGLKSIILGAQAIMLGQYDTVLVGGCESMSNAPHLLYARSGIAYGSSSLTDSIERDGLTDAFSHQSMGITAEAVAQQWGISREDQDLFAYQSQMKATQAQQQHLFHDEITPLSFTNKKGVTTTIDTDEFIKPETTLDKLNQLRPAFKKDTGSVTAGNSSGINDGAAALILMKVSKAKELNVPILATLTGYSEVGIDPTIMGASPIGAINTLLSTTQQSIDEIDYFELNEAFAAQSVAVSRSLMLPAEKVNPLGGAIALGHPIGASGARIVVTLVHQLCRTQAVNGIASLCVGGGIGLALSIKRSALFS